MSNRGKNTIISIASLLLGGASYIVFRENTYVAEFFDVFSFVTPIRESLSIFSCDFTNYYLQDFLWGLSLSCGIIAIYKPDRKGIFLSAFTAFICGCIWELVQYIGVVKGTGDFLDVLMYLSASLMSVLVNKERRE